MKRNYLLSIIAVVGIVIAVLVMNNNNRNVERRAQFVQPSQSPYGSSITGVGIVEVAAGNVDIGTPVSGVISDVYVAVGDHLNSGDALFKIDDRDLQAALVTAIATSEMLKISIQKPQHRLQYLSELQQTDSGAVNASELSELRDDLAEAQAAYTVSKAQIEQIQTDIERRTIRAPTDGIVLQLDIRSGEYAEAAASPAPIIVFGRNDTLWVRVDIDESVIWRFQPGANAVGYVRGNAADMIPLHFEFTEPLVTPKRTLTGRSTERTDVRVLQAVYSFSGADQPVYVGQMLDVYIDAGPDALRDRTAEP